MNWVEYNNLQVKLYNTAEYKWCHKPGNNISWSAIHIYFNNILFSQNYKQIE